MTRRRKIGWVSRRIEKALVEVEHCVHDIGRDSLAALLRNPEYASYTVKAGAQNLGQALTYQAGAMLANSQREELRARVRDEAARLALYSLLLSTVFDE